ncbi:beta-mannosidase [Amaricoccus macauensis]|uniref:beta-mannosidase n=1 Tax=Amaricoccus macauensis TaxID=57001 RepID=A0A840SCS6_9RHOB|nr:glycoside hydrolase family 2 protein [Amaricoccus macauensis]MBB5220609.1 beta-mannosidase [Amaricoccus macauensis]
MLDLSGDWALQDGEGRIHLTMRLPGDVHSALFDAGLIPDPYAGRNEYDVRWVADRDWILSRSFEHSGEGPATLVIDEFDTVGEIRLNGREVRSPSSAFQPVFADLGEALVPGTNLIEITLRSPTAAANERAARQPYPVPYHAGNCPIPNGNMLRKPQCDFGWDWGIALCPMGLYGRIAIAGPEGCIRSVRVEQQHKPGEVMATIAVHASGLGPASEVPWRATLCGVERTGVERVSGGLVWLGDVGLLIRDPDLWYPAGYGPQPIHDLVVELGQLRTVLKLALRDIRLVSEPDAVGRSFAFRVNGRPVFCRGANWIPADALPGRITGEKTTALLRSAAAANMNMVRVWGGGRYEPLSFYEACDALGLLVWQDLMFACHLYPSDECFLDDVECEVGTQVDRIGHHVALWCGDNELLGALNWFEESRRNRDRYLVAYDRLNRRIEAAVRRASDTANWWPSSPSPGPMSFGDAWHDDTSGDMHFWSVWHEGRDFEHYRDVRPRFCSEFGFQSFPSLPVIESFAAGTDLNISSPVMESHQKNAGGNARITETMLRYFRFPKDFANFVWLSQVQQGVAIRTAVDSWRSLKPHCMGTLYWQLNDTWPVASWSSLDYGGGWKILHHMARRFFAPIHVAAIPEGEAVRLMAMNDTAGPVEISLEVLAATLHGETRPLATAEARVGTEAAECLAEVPTGALGEGEFLAFRWRASDGGAGGDVLPLVRWKSLDLPDPKVTLNVTPDGRTLRARLSAQAVALFATVEASKPGRFSTNAVTIFPGHDAEIVFTPDDGEIAGVTLATRDLYSSFA